MLKRSGPAVWDEPPAPGAVGPLRRDVVLSALVVLAALVEVVVRSDVVWPVVSFGVVVVAAVSLPFRRTRPLAASAAAVAATSVVHAVGIAREVHWEGLVSAVVFVLLPYSLGRWASGRQLVVGLGVFAVPVALTAVGGGPVGDVLGGAAVLALAVSIGYGVRYRSISRRQQLERIRERERAALARELHDSVAHHVSSIAVQAHLARTFVTTDTAVTEAALVAISDEASQSLDEMRAIVRALRDDEADVRAPEPGVADLGALAGTGPGPTVTVEVCVELEDVHPAIGAALYRIGREAVTNARRHARHATTVTLVVTADDDVVRLTIDDDGRGATRPSSHGFGLRGMSERADLLGGRLTAGPRTDGGWNVTAVVPRRGVDR